MSRKIVALGFGLVVARGLIAALEGALVGAVVVWFGAPDWAGMSVALLAACVFIGPLPPIPQESEGSDG